MTELQEKKCLPCKGNVAPLDAAEILPLLRQLEGWTIIENHHLQKDYHFPNFVQALSWVNVVSAVAESQQHHPNISFTWGEVQLKIWSHKAKGLTENDFILAASIDRAFEATTPSLEKIKVPDSPKEHQT